eukprot:9982312-Alexandrium_andersonii.AAC.1
MGKDASNGFRLPYAASGSVGNLRAVVSGAGCCRDAIGTIGLPPNMPTTTPGSRKRLSYTAEQFLNAPTLGSLHCKVPKVQSAIRPMLAKAPIRLNPQSAM